MSAGVVESLGLADDGFQGFVKGLVSTILKLISMMLAQSISQAIAGATASGAATGPAAIFTTPAFIATAVGGVMSAFAAIPKFADVQSQSLQMVVLYQAQHLVLWENILVQNRIQRLLLHLIN
jgi:hypothetical protein